MTLAQLITAAFPADWADGGIAPDEALDRALRALEPDEWCRIAREIEEVRGRGLCDMQLDALIAYELGSHLRPAQMGLTPSEWMTWLVSTLKARHFQRVGR